MPFDGETYEPSLDCERLTDQLSRVLDFMLEYEHTWHTLAEIAAAVDAPEPSCSARLRDLRKRKFGSWVILRERVKDGNGLHHYKIDTDATPRSLPDVQMADA